MYTITGATGHVGRRIVERLLIAGQPVRAVARERSKLLELEREGAEIWAGDLRQPEFLTRAFEDARGVFTMIPPLYGAPNMRIYQGKVGEAIVEAVQRAGVRHVVNLSSLGAELEHGTGPILGLHDQEERLNELEGVNVLHLRPTFFMENLLGSIPLLVSRHVFGTALRGDLRFPAIATRDIAEAASQHLLRLDFSGQVVRPLLGERDLTPNEIATVLGGAIGTPELPYVQLPYEDVHQALIEMGCSADVARAMVEMMRGMNEGHVIAGTPRTPEATTATTIEDFAIEFAQAYTAATKHAQAA